MLEKNKNLSGFKSDDMPDAEGMTFAIIVSDWNTEITEALKEAAVETLLAHHVLSENIDIHHVPGSFELPLAAQWALEHLEVDAVICLGCVIQGETRHFEFICQSVSQSIAQLNLNYARPVIFGVLTTYNIQQALERAGGTHGNKGTEAAVTAIKMVELGRKITAN